MALWETTYVFLQVVEKVREMEIQNKSYGGHENIIVTYVN
jgi:hypothetical protein